MEGNRGMEMRIGGESVRVGGEREGGQRRLKRKRRFIEHNISADVNTTKGDMQILITFMRS